MKKKNITYHQLLSERIAVLKDECAGLEIKLKGTIAEIAQSISPASILKSSVKQLSTDKEFRTEAVVSGLSLGANFLIEKILGRSKSIKGFLSSVLVEDISTPLINLIVKKFFTTPGSSSNKNNTETQISKPS